MAVTVIKGGLETTVQDYPGRKGAFGMGFPPSGPIDHWSFRLANILVGNAPGAAALECAFIGPVLRFERDTVIALTGADMKATLDGDAVPLWESARVRTGQTLALGFRRHRRAHLYRLRRRHRCGALPGLPRDLRHRCLRRPGRGGAQGRIRPSRSHPQKPCPAAD